MILPFTIFNYTRFNRFVLLNTNAGYAFYWANHPIHGTHFYPILPANLGSYTDLIPDELLSLDEAALDQELLKLGVQIVINNPVRYLILSISRIPPYIMFWPSSDSGAISNISRATSFGILWPFMLYGLIRAFTRPYSPDGFKITSPIFLLLLFVIVYSVIHILSWTLIRYRLPLDAVLLIFAGVAVYDLYYRWIIKKTPIVMTAKSQEAAG